MGDPVRTGIRAGFAAIIAVAASLPTQIARAQSGPADMEYVMVIPLHPSTPTTLQLPDEIVDVRMLHRGEFLIEIVGQDVNLRPRPEIPAGTEAVVIVETRGTRRRFLLRVVERREDAVHKLALSPAKPVEPLEHTAEARQELPRVMPAEPQPAASAPESATIPPPAAPAQPRAGDEPTPEPAREPAEPVTERAAPADAARAFDLSVHALVSLGVTALDVPGYEPDNARQVAGALGLRLTLAPHEKSWALEAGVSGERLTGSITYLPESGEDLTVRGTWFRAEAGLRAWTGTRWMPTAYVGLGFQAHLETKEEARRGRDRWSSETMEPGAALVAGMGLRYRAGNVLLGLEFQGRYGGPDDYFSIGALWTVGRFLDQGD